MNVTIETIPHTKHRYPTVGDYWWEGCSLRIKVSETGDWRMNMLVAVHELVEALLAEERGISEEVITAFDLSVPDHPDPGHHPDAPYRKEHFFAECIERLLCAEFGIMWQEYEARLDEL